MADRTGIEWTNGSWSPTATRQTARKRPRATGPPKRVRDVVRARDGGMCVACGITGAEVHHRRPRALGGSTDPAANRASNLILLCAPCHRAVEGDPPMMRRGYNRGWKVKQGTDPRLVRCWIVGRGPVFLLDDGQIAAQPEPT